MRRLGYAAGALACCFLTGSARAGEPTFEDSEVLEPKPRLELELAQTRVSAYSQRGYGYQSQAGPLGGPGSETLHVLQVQGEFVLRQGDHLTHQLWVPVDVVTSASANANDRYYATPDVISTASAQNVAKEADYQLSIRPNHVETYSGRVGFHAEEPFGSWVISFGYQRLLADDNATLGLNVSQVLDWFNTFALGGKRNGRASRATTSASASLSQLLSTTTIVAFGADVSLSHGLLSNSWNTVPLEAGGRQLELLPADRQRVSATLRLAQWLPWNGALGVSYRLYGDSWHVLAHSVEAELRQRAASWLTLAATYRYHRQTGVEFFTIRAPVAARYASADSDLAALGARTLGGYATVSLPTRAFGVLFYSLGYDRYVRTDHLEVDVATWASGFRF